MDQNEIEAKLRQSVGQTIKVKFDGYTETVFVVSADMDGFVCRMQSTPATDIYAEFWIAYKDVSALSDF
jgi:hypothetical protein